MAVEQRSRKLGERSPISALRFPTSPALTTQELVVEQRLLQLASMILEVQEQIGHLKQNDKQKQRYYPE